MTSLVMQIQLFEQLTFSVPRIVQFINTMENLRFDDAIIMFKNKEVDVLMFFREMDMYAFSISVDCWHFDWQVSSVAQIAMCLAKCSLWWSNSLLNTKFIVSHLKRIMMSTRSSGASFLGHLAM